MQEPAVSLGAELAHVVGRPGAAAPGPDASRGSCAEQGTGQRRPDDRSVAKGGLPFLDAAIPPCAAIIAIGEVFGYVAPATGRLAALGSVFARCHDALEPGGLLMFDLAGPGRLQARDQSGWTAGPGWVVLVETHVESDTLIREIVTFRDCGRSRYRRSEETHRLQLHRPADVLAQLRRNRFTARTLRPAYGAITLPSGLTAYIGKRKRDECRCIVRRASQRAGLTPTEG